MAIKKNKIEIPLEMQTSADNIKVRNNKIKGKEKKVKSSIFLNR